MTLRRQIASASLLLFALLLQGCAHSVKAPDSQGAKAESTSMSTDRMLSLMNQADAAYESQQWVGASKLYQLILKQIPTDAYAWFRLGNALTQQGQLSQAVFAYETSLAHDSAQFKPWFNLSTAHLLKAKVATLNSLRSTRASDPSREMALSRMDELSLLLR